MKTSEPTRVSERRLPPTNKHTPVSLKEGNNLSVYSIENRMPRFRKSYRKNYKKKVRKKRKKYGKEFIQKVGPGLEITSPFKNKMMCKHRYYAEINLDSSGGAPATHVFSLNSLFDPDVTGTGHQPMFYDTMANIYNHYTVIGSRARISASNTDTAGQQTLLASIQGGPTVLTNIPQIVENGQCRYTQLGVETTSAASKELTINFSANKYFNTKVLNDDIYVGGGGNPTEQAYLHVTVNPLVFAEHSVVRVRVLLEYIAIWREPKMVSQS